MVKWLAGCGAAASRVYRVFDHKAPIAVVYYFRERVRFARPAQTHDALALLHEARQQNLPSRRRRLAERHQILAEASLRGARLSRTSLSGIFMLAGASLYGVSLGGTWGRA
jgi:hypothetical protein